MWHIDSISDGLLKYLSLRSVAQNIKKTILAETSCSKLRTIKIFKFLIFNDYLTKKEWLVPFSTKNGTKQLGIERG